MSAKARELVGFWVKNSIHAAERSGAGHADRGSLGPSAADTVILYFQTDRKRDDHHVLDLVDPVEAGRGDGSKHSNHLQLIRAPIRVLHFEHDSPRDSS